MTIALGFDLGLDTLRVAALVDDRVELVASLPAAIAFADGHVLVGAAAYTCAPRDRVDDLLAWLGRAAPGGEGVAGLAWPLVAGRRRSPVELVARLFRAGAHAAELRFGRAVGAVIAVPVELGAVERRGLRDAAIAAGLPAVRLIAAPAAAALAIADGQPARVLIVDAGATATRVAIVESAGGTMDLLGHAEATDAGGRAVDRAIATQLAIETGAPDRSRVDVLAPAARALKEGLPPPIGLHRTPRRHELGLWSAPSAWALDGACQAALAAGAVELAGMSSAILIGGGAQLPTLAARFHRLVGALARPLDDAATVTARGAARAAQMFVDEPAAVTVDVIPSSFALGAGSAMAAMIPAGAIAPTREVRLIARDRPERTAVEVELWEEQASPRRFGRYQITGLPPGAGAIAACELTVDVDRIPRLEASDLVNGGALTIVPLIEVGLAPEAVAALRTELIAWTP